MWCIGRMPAVVGVAAGAVVTLSFGAGAVTFAPHPGDGFSDYRHAGPAEDFSAGLYEVQGHARHEAVLDIAVENVFCNSYSAFGSECDSAIPAWRSTEISMDTFYTATIGKRHGERVTDFDVETRYLEVTHPGETDPGHAGLLGEIQSDEFSGELTRSAIDATSAVEVRFRNPVSLRNRRSSTLSLGGEWLPYGLTFANAASLSPYDTYDHTMTIDYTLNPVALEAFDFASLFSVSIEESLGLFNYDSEAFRVRSTPRSSAETAHSYRFRETVALASAPVPPAFGLMLGGLAMLGLARRPGRAGVWA